ncbi:MAG: hypothetical protein U5L07_14730 [Desulfobacterales bacterium]|nr:hypothetical protein [Desulfobacterales bacterium]
MQKFFIITLAILLFVPGLSPATPDEKLREINNSNQNNFICIDKKEQTFGQVLEDIGQQTNLNIKTRGNEPAVTKDISFSEISLKEALSKILKLYDVRNHAAIYNSEKATLTLYLFESYYHIAGLPSQSETQSDLTFIEPLTQEQIDQLIPEKEHEPLTQEQIDQLIPEKEHEPLTQEQIDQLIPEKEHKPLTPEQTAQLIPEKEHKPLTQEQINQLIPAEIPPER